MKALSNSQLHKLFKLPKFRFVLLDKPLYHSINVEKYAKVEYSKVKPHLMLFHVDSLNPGSKNQVEHDMTYMWYTSAHGGSAVSYGPSFMYDPQLAAQQVAFWVPLEYWCCFEQNYKSFQKDFTIGIRIDNDNVPIKVKRIWVKKFIEALTQYTLGEN